MCLTNSNGREGQNKLGQIRKKQKEIEESKRKQRRKKVRKKDKKKKEERRGSENRQDEKTRTMYFGAKKKKQRKICNYTSLLYSWLHQGSLCARSCLPEKECIFWLHNFNNAFIWVFVFVLLIFPTPEFCLPICILVNATSKIMVLL